jgi:hypothetical protein
MSVTVRGQSRVKTQDHRVSKELSTTLEVVGEISRFHVETSNPTYRDLLAHMGFARSGGIDHVRDFPVTPHMRASTRTSPGT